MLQIIIEGGLHEKTYSLEDLKIGMVVRAEELSNIYNTFIVLDNATMISNSESIQQKER